MTTLTTAWMLGCVCGFLLGVTVASRRPTCRELMRDRNRQPTFAELLTAIHAAPDNTRDSYRSAGAAEREAQ